MNEYISKQSVIDYLMGYLNSIGECGADSLLFDRGQRRALINSIQDISVIKGADVQPVKHGRWISTEELYYNGMTKCSCCNEEYYIEDIQNLQGDLRVANFCPNCGARMDGGSE